MFCAIGEDAEKRCIITLKGEPGMNELMRNTYDDVKPAYFMNKEHWASIYMDGNVPDEVMKQMVDSSYNLVLNSLTKKLRKELLG